MPISQIAASEPPATITSASPCWISRARVADRVRPGRAGGHHRVVRPLEAVADRHLPRAEVDQRAGDEERRHPPRPLVAQGQRRLGDRSEPADARADDHPGALAVGLVLGHPVRVAHRLLGRRDGEDDEGVDLALVLRRHPVVGVEGPVRAVAEGTSQAMSQARWLASKRVILPAPDCPAISRDQVSSTPQASGETMPSPVMTTRRISAPLRCPKVRFARRRSGKPPRGQVANTARRRPVLTGA